MTLVTHAEKLYFWFSSEAMDKNLGQDDPSWRLAQGEELVLQQWGLPWGDLSFLIHPETLGCPA